MINEPLLNSQRIQQQRSSLKTVQLIFLGSLKLKTNDLGDQPIFQKQCFSYDKYELAKIISFDDLQLLFRPYKNDPRFKKFNYWNKMKRILPIILILILGSSFIFFIQNPANITIIIWAISLLGLFTLSFIILFCHSKAEDKCINGLQDYCKALQSQQNNIQIKFVRLQLICFDVQSKTIEEDDKAVKLYKVVGFNLLFFSLSKPIITYNSYYFDKNRLQKIISFEQLQLIFRPFMQNQAYQKTYFWNRIYLLLITSIWLIMIMNIYLVPLLDSGKNDKYQDIYFRIFYVLYVGSQVVRLRTISLYAQLIHNFIEYCQIISRNHQIISVIPHIKQRRTANCCQRTDLDSITDIYCLQVKSKQV